MVVASVALQHVVQSVARAVGVAARIDQLQVLEVVPQGRIPGLGPDRVVTFAAVLNHLAADGVELVEVIARAADQYIGPKADARDEYIVAGTAHQRVAAVVANERVVAVEAA